MAEYQLMTNQPNAIMRTADRAVIPFDPANRDYQDFLQWLQDGNQPDPTEAASGEDSTFTDTFWTF
jgi:hypothetical protein